MSKHLIIQEIKKQEYYTLKKLKWYIFYLINKLVFQVAIDNKVSILNNQDLLHKIYKVTSHQAKSNPKHYLKIEETEISKNCEEEQEEEP